MNVDWFFYPKNRKQRLAVVAVFPFVIVGFFTGLIVGGILCALVSPFEYVVLGRARTFKVWEKWFIMGGEGP